MKQRRGRIKRMMATSSAVAGTAAGNTNRLRGRRNPSRGSPARALSSAFAAEADAPWPPPAFAAPLAAFFAGSAFTAGALPAAWPLTRISLGACERGQGPCGCSATNRRVAGRQVGQVTGMRGGTCPALSLRPCVLQHGSLGRLLLIGDLRAEQGTY